MEVLGHPYEIQPFHVAHSVTSRIGVVSGMKNNVPVISNDPLVARGEECKFLPEVHLCHW
jgi:hypothetical protein